MQYLMKKFEVLASILSMRRWSFSQFSLTDGRNDLRWHWYISIYLPWFAFMSVSLIPLAEMIVFAGECSLSTCHVWEPTSCCSDTLIHVDPHWSAVVSHRRRCAGIAPVTNDVRNWERSDYRATNDIAEVLYFMVSSCHSDVLFYDMYVFGLCFCSV